MSEEENKNIANARAKIWYAANKERKKEYDKKYREKNSGKQKLARAEYFQKNKDRMLAQSKEWSQKNKEKSKEIKKAWTARNRAYVSAKAIAWQKANPEKARAIRKKSTEKNREKVRARKNAWNRANAEKARVRVAAWNLANPERRKSAAAEYRKENVGKIRAYQAVRRSFSERATPSWAIEFFMDEAYRLAKLRTKVLGFPWSVDHIVPLNSPLVCGLHVHNNLRVIPTVENLRKGNRHWPDMP